MNLTARAFAFTALAALSSLAAQTAPDYDLLLRNGTVVDGSGAPPFRADVAVKDGRIARLGDLKEASARRTIDASGLVVAPGFIDVHTHADDLAAKPRAESFLRMGVTTLVAGNCGSSAVEIGKELEEIRKAGPSVNFATLIGHGSVRHAVMGDERRAPTPAEMERLKALVAKAMADGAMGLSTGLQYVPGSYAELDEIAELARVACRAGGLYTSHMRNEGTEIEAAIAETLAVGEKAGCPVQISHLKIDSPNRWGSSAKALAMIEEARARGLDVEADQYAYTAASSTLSIRFPDWALEGGQEAVRQYVREKKVLSLEEAVRKMTSLPAAHFRLGGRGLVKEGYAADLAVFDPTSVSDRATFEQPRTFAGGFRYVLVNGEPVIDNGVPTAKAAGQVLRPAPR